MKKVLIVALLAMATPAFAAQLLTNGDFSAGQTGWTYWTAAWGTENVSTATGAAVITGSASGGLYQVVNATPGTTVTLTGNWSGAPGGGGWIEVMLFNIYNSDGVDPTNSPAMMNSYLDNATWPPPTAAGNTTPDALGRIGINQRIVNKRSTWDLGGASASGTLQTSLVTGNGGNADRGNYMNTNVLTVGPDGKVGVCIKAGGTASPVTYDNLVLDGVPEPATALLLGLPLLFVRRRRA
jgi:hypothetical protein